jgi:DNA repair ATPase RecN
MQHRDPRVPYALMDDDPLPANMRRRAEEELRRWKDMDRQSAQMTQQAENLLTQADDLSYQARQIESEWRDIWRELGLPYP